MSQLPSEEEQRQLLKAFKQEDAPAIGGEKQPAQDQPTADHNAFRFEEVSKAQAESKEGGDAGLGAGETNRLLSRILQRLDDLPQEMADAFRVNG